MIVDCMTCPVRGQRCDDCVVTALQVGTVELQLDPAERRAVSMFVGAGLVRRGAAERLRARHESADQRDPYGRSAGAVWDPVWEVG